MMGSEFKSSLRENKGGIKIRYYFGEPAPNYPQINHWEYNIRGTIYFKGSTLIFRADNFSPKQPRKNILFESYYENMTATGVLILKLDLKELRKMKIYPNKNRNYNFIWLRFFVHGIFLKDKIKDLNFSIRAETKEQLLNLYNKIKMAKNSKKLDSEAGSLSFIEN